MALTDAERLQIISMALMRYSVAKGAGYSLRYAFTGDNFRRANISIAAGPFGPDNAIRYTSTETLNRLIIGNQGMSPVPVLYNGTQVRINYSAKYPSQGAIWFMLASGADKVLQGTQTLSKNIDFIDSGWLNSGDTYVVPSGTQYVWFNFHRTDNEPIFQDDLFSFQVLEKNI